MDFLGNVRPQSLTTSEEKINKFTFHFILSEVLLRILTEVVGGFAGWWF